MTSACDGLASHFVWINRSKESLTLDLKQPSRAGGAAGSWSRRPTCWCRTSRPARRRGWAWRPRRCSAKHPRLIVCDISGYGDRRPVPRQEGLRPADPERGGLPVGHRHARRRRARSASRSPTSRPACTPTPASSRRCCSAGKTGKGRRIDVSMLESLAEWMGYPLYYAFDGAPPPPRTGAAHATIYPYGPFAAGDGRHVMLGLQNEREWRGVLRQGAAAARSSRAIRASTPTPSAREPRGAAGAIIVETLRAR